MLSTTCSVLHLLRLPILSLRACGLVAALLVVQQVRLRCSLLGRVSRFGFGRLTTARNRASSSSALVLMLLFVGCRHARTEAKTAVKDAPEIAGTSWPTPEGWRREVIPFPLDFAPEIGYRGVEELRFAPRFFDPAAPTYWSYAFAWLLEGAPE